MREEGEEVVAVYQIVDAVDAAEAEGGVDVDEGEGSKLVHPRLGALALGLIRCSLIFST